MAEKVTITLPDGSTHERAEPAIKLRTSTKVALSTILIPLLGSIPFYDQINAMLLAACQSEQGPTVYLSGVVAAGVTAYVTARLSKSPAKPGAL